MTTKNSDTTPDAEMATRVKALIKKHEGCSLDAYPDANGWSVGFGSRIHDEKITRALDAGGSLAINRLAAEEMFEQGYAMAVRAVRSWFGHIPAGARGAALIDMAYTLGPVRLRQFINLKDAVSMNDWLSASMEAMDSKWSEDVGDKRAGRVADMLKTGLWPIL